MNKTKQKKQAMDIQSGPGFDRYQQRVLISVRDRFRADVRSHDNPLKEFGEGQHLTAAMWVWLEFIPPDLRWYCIGWACGYAKYDPSLGQHVRDALSGLVRLPMPGQFDLPGTLGIGR